MALNGFKYEDPQNQRYMERGVEATIAALEKRIEILEKQLELVLKRVER